MSLIWNYICHCSGIIMEFWDMLSWNLECIFYCGPCWPVFAVNDVNMAFFFLSPKVFIIFTSSVRWHLLVRINIEYQLLSISSNVWDMTYDHMFCSDQHHVKSPLRLKQCLAHSWYECLGTLPHTTCLFILDWFSSAGHFPNYSCFWSLITHLLSGSQVQNLV